ncbi:MAG: DUF2306 domain-containing protein, partial [Nevskiales bacterium]
ASAITRGVAVSRVLAGAPVDELSAQDTENMQTLAGLARSDAGSRWYQEAEAVTRAGAARYNAVPITTLLHIVPGAVFLFVAPLQLVPRFRTRRPGVHRRLGYVLLGLAVPYALTGIFFSLHKPVFGPLAAAASGLAGTWFVYSTVRAYAAIRRRDIDRHREWMLRAMAAAYGIAAVRLVFLAMVIVVPFNPIAMGATSFWAGWLVAALPMEWWIRQTRRERQTLRWAS